MKRLNWILTSIVLALVISGCTPDNTEDKSENLWHNQTRELRYKPDGKGFVINNGTHRFNRALYGSNTGFRVEAGDLPEFALYLPRVGGTFRLGLLSGENSKWLINAEDIEARYEAGTMTYTIEDPMLKGGSISLQLLALDDADGMILRAEGTDVPEDVELFWAFGGANGKRFSRDGDLGADPESVFYLTPEKCENNAYFISNNAFNLYYASGRNVPEDESGNERYDLMPEENKNKDLTGKKRLYGVVPPGSDLKTGDATKQDSPKDFYNSSKAGAPAVNGKLTLKNDDDYYFLLVNPDTRIRPSYDELPEIFTKADVARKVLADRIKIETPDDYINAVGASLATAADAVWDGKSFMHGAIAWRMPLNGWRGAYAADWLGWHERAKTHFRGYYKAQYTEPASGPSVPDPKTHLARQKEEVGTALFTSGYISRRPGKINKPHHYDMNLVFIAQVLSHVNWTGDTAFIKESWPVIERHMAWEKRNFDPDDDGLYNAYCCIWASDALQYRGGGVTHSSAYNYRANKVVAQLAKIIGKDPAPYAAEAEKIKKAVDENLWLDDKGWYAEYKDILGNELVHPMAAVWTAYHAVDEGIADPFQAWQTTAYVDHYIPHIPVEAEGLEPGHYTISTTNWMPYTWSINNVALAEVLHTALAYWQAGRTDKAFELTKGSFFDFMFLGTSPGNFGQLSHYDAFRGELYRDFADPVGMASRALVEGLFGVQPDMLNQKLTVEPGWPEAWDHALLETPDIKIDYKQNGNIDQYEIHSSFSTDVSLVLNVKARSDKIKAVTVNAEAVGYDVLKNNVGSPVIKVSTAKGNHFKVTIEWDGIAIAQPAIKEVYARGDKINLSGRKFKVLEYNDPQGVLREIDKTGDGVALTAGGETGFKTVFVRLSQGEMVWWQPLSFELRNPIDVVYNDDVQPKEEVHFVIRNNSDKSFDGSYALGSFQKEILLKANAKSDVLQVPEKYLIPGTNRVLITDGEKTFEESVINWNLAAGDSVPFESVNMASVFNERVTHIFEEQYYSPRSPYPTLSIPVQGIGDWCSYRETEEIEDEGLRKVAGSKGEIVSPQGIPFAISGKEGKNILFTSKWDNYPDSASLDLSGRASHIYLLMAGSAHHMQMNMMNGRIRVEYADGSSDVLPLKSPENWWPIEQDYYEDGYAFEVKAPRPPRLYLKTGDWHMDTYNVLKKNGTNRIEGGAASLLDLTLKSDRELKSLTLMTNTTDVVIGLMAATLQRVE